MVSKKTVERNLLFSKVVGQDWEICDYILVNARFSFHKLVTFHFLVTDFGWEACLEDCGLSLNVVDMNRLENIYANTLLKVLVVVDHAVWLRPEVGDIQLHLFHSV